MKKITIIILMMIINSSVLISQNKFEFEASEGFIFFDYFGNEPEGWDNQWAGYGLQSEIEVWNNIYNNNKLKIKIGTGYTQFNYLAGYYSSFFADANNISKSQFVNFKLGAEYKPQWSKISLTLNSTHYFNILKRFHAQYKWFTNLDIGLKCKIYKNFSISIWTPITLRPILDGFHTSKPIQFLKLGFDPWIEMTGLNLGLSYSFGKKRKDNG